jgi:hypothetical protein
MLAAAEKIEPRLRRPVLYELKVGVLSGSATTLKNTPAGTITCDETRHIRRGLVRDFQSSLVQCSGRINPDSPGGVPLRAW